MSFLDHLQSLHESVEDLFEQVELTTTEELLDEAVEKFADIPNTWKKSFVKGRASAGENSEMVVKTTGRIKNKSALNKVLKDTLNDVVNNAGAIIEIDGKSVAAIFSEYGGEKKYKIADDANKLKEVSRSHAGTFRNNYVRHYYKDSTLGIQETIDGIYAILGSAAAPVLNSKEEDETKHIKIAGIEDALSIFNITITVVGNDAQRAAKAKERADNRTTDDSNPVGSTAIRQKVITKFTKEHLEPLYKRIESNLPKLDSLEKMMANAIEGKTAEVNIKDITDDLNKLNSILNSFRSAYKTGKIKKGWQSELDYDMRWLNDRLKSIK